MAAIEGIGGANDLAVELHGVRKAYCRGGVSTPVLEDVHLSVPRGTAAFLVGPSGSGKTTLLSILGCILQPDAGEVRLLGTDLSRLDEGGRIALRRQRIGFVFQRFHLIRGLTALENVVVPLTLQDLPLRAARLRARQLLEDVGLAERMHAQPNRLSTGQCQRVALARALAGDPDLILADEPTASLDEASGRAVMELLRRLTTSRGKTAIAVTHDPRIHGYADRIYCMESGRIVEEQCA